MTVPPVGQLLDLTGQVAVVAGAGRGIGAGIARRLAEAGAAIVIHYRRRGDEARGVVADIEQMVGSAVAIESALSDQAQARVLLAAAAERFGTVDILVNNAGVYPTQPLLEMSSGTWRETFASNIDATFLSTQAAAEHMIAGGGGSIVNICSIAGLVPSPQQSHYSSAKAGVAMFTRAAAQELGRFGIRVNAVSPGLVARPAIEEEWPDGVARWRDRAPLARIGEPDDIADACLFLVSPAARWITGHNLVVDGGVTAAAAY